MRPIVLRPLPYFSRIQADRKEIFIRPHRRRYASARVLPSPHLLTLLPDLYPQPGLTSRASFSRSIHFVSLPTPMRQFPSMNPRLLLLAFTLASATLSAQSFPAAYNNNEAAIAPYTLLDPLTSLSGKPVTKNDWPTRRAQIIKLSHHHAFGRTPASAQHLPLRPHLDEQDDHALNGT